ncbi:hypothetical protein [Rhodococcus sp. P1Y]|uniref:hypothetical protein n=1 Tax=Rhodococcus sp. P1Y TaxID=1302308 RepID=UPI000EB1E53B|nr:hypothetical protein [Rhodococcus sp. P1Y]AYJ48912.1 hypothetical protein D8W71_11800 [Rhodococcus sp. P1Y]
MSLTAGPASSVVNAPVGRERSESRTDLVDTALPAVAILCLVVHVVLLVVTGTSMLVMVVPMLVLSSLCVAFTCGKGNSHRVRDYAVTAGFGVAMLAAHWALTSASLGHSNHMATEGPAMDHAAMGQGSMGHGSMSHGTVGHGAMDMAGSGSVVSGGQLELLMQAGLFLAAVQVLLAVGAAVRALRTSGE